MRRRRYLLVIPATLSVGLASCTSPPEPDWVAAQAQTDAFIETARTSGDFLGAGTLRATQDSEVPRGGEAITLDYPSEVRVDGIRAVCFGSGEATFGLLVRAESSWEVIGPPALTCDGEPRTVPLDEPLERINALRLNGQIQDDAGAVIAAAVTGSAG